MYMYICTITYTISINYAFTNYLKHCYCEFTNGWLQHILEETRARLGDVRKNEGKYKDMLQRLLTQVLLAVSGA